MLILSVIGYAGVCEASINSEVSRSHRYLDNENEIYNDKMSTRLKKIEKIKKQSRKVTATVYNPVRKQCDNSPLITADNSKICLKTLNSGKLRWIAVSRDLRKHYPYGTKVYIYCEENPRLNGYWEVHDTMNPRWKNKIDLLMPEKIKKGKWEVLISKIKIEEEI